MCPSALTQRTHSTLKAPSRLALWLKQHARDMPMVLYKVGCHTTGSGMSKGAKSPRQLCVRHELRGAVVMVGMGVVSSRLDAIRQKSLLEKPSPRETTNFPALDHFSAQHLTHRRSMHGSAGCGGGYSGCRQAKEARKSTPYHSGVRQTLLAHKRISSVKLLHFLSRPTSQEL